MKQLAKKISVAVFFIIAAAAAVFMTVEAANGKIDDLSSQLDDFIREKYHLSLSVYGTDISFFPPRISFEKISVSGPDGEIAEMEECFVYDIANLMFSKDKNIKTKCMKSRFFADKMIRAVSLIERKNGKNPLSGSDAAGTGKKSLLFETNAQFISGAFSQKFDMSLTFSKESGRLSLKETGDGGRAEIMFSPASKKATVRLDALDLSVYSELIKRRTPLEISEGRIDALFEISQTGQGVFLCGSDLSVKNIAFFHPVIDSFPFRIPLFRFSGEIMLDINKKALSTTGADISLGGIDAVFSGSYAKEAKKFSIQTKSVSLNKLETLIHDSTFDNYLFGGDLELFAEYSETNGEAPVFSVTGNLVEPKQLSDRLDYLKRTFDYTFTGNDGIKRTIVVGERNPRYTPVSLVPEHLIWAIVVSEDAGFFIHKGVDFQELDAAVKDNIKKHKMRGGSTIPQQLAKNLFLNRDKTLLRKFREVLLAIELDATLSKERMLEIYLNIIEWAPGVFGISQAADYYFGKTPDELTPLESAYLASVIPGPAKYHYQFLTKNVTENWYKSLCRILNIMNETGHLTLDEYIDALHQTVNFRENDDL